MKNFLLIFTILLSTSTYAQTDSLQNVLHKYIVENGNVTYITVFDFPGKSKEQIKDMVTKQLSSNPILSIIQASISPDQLEASFSNYTVNYKKYGFKWGNTGVWVYHPAQGNFTVQFKDDKYRVIVKAVKFVVSNQLVFNFNSDFATKDNKLRNIENANQRRAYYAFGKNMDEMFDTRNQAASSNW
jgi:hypothetical protein